MMAKPATISRAGLAISTPPAVIGVVGRSLVQMLPSSGSTGKGLLQTLGTETLQEAHSSYAARLLARVLKIPVEL